MNAQKRIKEQLQILHGIEKQVLSKVERTMLGTLKLMMSKLLVSFNNLDPLERIKLLVIG